MASPGSIADPAQARVAHVVLDWLTHQLRVHDRRALLITDPGSPEAGLLTAWLDSAGLAWNPAPQGGRSLAHSLADARLDAPDLLPVAVLHKSAVLLDGAPAAALPLGDLWAADIVEWAGDCSLPEGFDDLARLLSVEEAIRSGLNDQSLRRSLQALGDDARGIETRLRRVATLNRGPQIPKLGADTPGMDLLLS